MPCRVQLKCDLLTEQQEGRDNTITTMKQDNKKMTALFAENSRAMVDKVNSLGIQKEDIVQVLPSNEGFVLLYYI